MCGLCGTLGGEQHWTVDGHVSQDSGFRRRERYRCIALANRILGMHRLKIEDFQGVSYVLSSATGKQEIVSDLGALWRVAETLSGTQFDPLDPLLLQQLQRGDR